MGVRSGGGTGSETNGGQLVLKEEEGGGWGRWKIHFSKKLKKNNPEASEEG